MTSGLHAHAGHGVQANRRGAAVALRRVTAAAGIGLSLTGAWACRPSAGPPLHYEDPKAMIHTFEDSGRDEWQMPERVVRSLQIENTAAVIADVGAGSGYFTRRLAAEVPEGKVYAVDVDSTFEDHILDNREAWGTPNIEPRLAHYDDPMLPDGGLDLVFTANTYSFIRDRRAYFAKVLRALKPGGRLVVIDYRPAAQVPVENAPEPRYRVAEATARAELESAGFALQRAETFLPHQYFLVLTAAP